LTNTLVLPYTFPTGMRKPAGPGNGHRHTVADRALSMTGMVRSG